MPAFFWVSAGILYLVAALLRPGFNELMARLPPGEVINIFTPDAMVGISATLFLCGMIFVALEIS